MSTAVASAPAAPFPPLDRNPSPRSYPPLAPSSASQSSEKAADLTMSSELGNAPSSTERTPSDGKRSPRSLRSTGNPKIIVKKEPPSSPSIPGNARHRPRKLDLNTNTANITGPANSRPSATPLTARDGLAIQDVGFACLSPGFQTQDPTMREQLQRSISVRDQQRSIIEQRLLKSAKGDGSESSRLPESATGFGKAPPTSSKKRPPNGLSIVPPPAEHFANERVVQSAPLHQSFTGRHQPNAANRPAANPTSGLSQSSHIHHIPAIQTNNRLPPISDVLGNGELNPGTGGRPPFLHTSSTPIHTHGPPHPSPGFPPRTAHPMSQPSQLPFERPREYRSAEEAVQEMTGGREDLQPKIVHYGGHQPPTPPSPQPRANDNLTPHKYQPQGQLAGRRRSRNEYEADSSPPLGSGPPRYSGPFGEGRDSPSTQKAKKEEFLTLCSRAWDLFHS